MDTNWAKNTLQAYGSNQSEWARYIGLTPDKINKALRDIRQLKPDELFRSVDFFVHLGVDKQEASVNLGIPSNSHLQTKLMKPSGVILNAGEVFYLQPIDKGALSLPTQPIVLTKEHEESLMVANPDLLDKVESPVHKGSNLIALRVGDDSMQPLLYKGDSVFYEASSKVPDIKEGRRYVIALETGQILIRQVIKTNENQYTLISGNSQPQINVNLLWASPILYIKHNI